MSNEPAAAPPPTPRRLRPTLADWIDLVALHQADEGRRDAELRRRDRRIGREVAYLGARPVAKLVAWVRRVHGVPPEGDAQAGVAAAEEASPGRSTAEAVRLSALALGALGFLLGASAAAGALSFQPRGRINVVAVLVLLVGVPGVFLALALLNALPSPLRRRLPWLGGEPEGGRLQPARWALRALPQAARERLEAAWGRGQAWERLTARLRRWLLLSASQGAAVAFQLGALGAALALVVFTDLSFGWSTTLEVDARALRRVTDALSAPWATLWPAARPSAELIEASRFYRIAGGPDPDVPLATYGRWWPFVLMTLAVYGLLPRVAFLAVARRRLRRALRRAFLEAPGSARALDRLDSPLLESAGLHGEPEATPAAAGMQGETAWAALPARAVVVSWAEARAAGAAADLACEEVECFEAGGSRTPDEDSEVARRVGARADGSDAPVVLLVRGFEPPLAEVFDFLRELRAALGSGHALFVAPLGGGEVERAAWRRRVAAAGDPWLRLADAGAAGAVATP